MTNPFLLSLVSAYRSRFLSRLANSLILYKHHAHAVHGLAHFLCPLNLKKKTFIASLLPVIPAVGLSVAQGFIIFILFSLSLPRFVNTIINASTLCIINNFRYSRIHCASFMYHSSPFGLTSAPRSKSSAYCLSWIKFHHIFLSLFLLPLSPPFPSSFQSCLLTLF